jgi:hypothetical protein
LLSGILADGSYGVSSTSSDLFSDLNNFADNARKDVEKYFPVLPFQTKIDVKVSSGNSKNIEFIVPFSSKILSLFQDIDYYAPIWFNIFAIIAFVFK